MAPKVHFERATHAHAVALAKVMRVSDCAEILAGGYQSPLEALVSSLATSDVAYAMLFDGEVAAIFGVAPYRVGSALGPLKAGVAWSLTGRAVAKHPRTFLKWSRPALAVLRSHCSYLVNTVDARYTGALRWLARIGFEIGKPEPMGPLDQPFCFVSIGRP